MNKGAVSWTGLLLLALLSVPPLLAGGAAHFLPPFRSTTQTVAAEVAVLVLMALALGLRAALDQRQGQGRPAMMALFAGFAALMTACHWLLVDTDPTRMRWQLDTYLGILNRTADAPHRFRPLPYGFVRLLEVMTHDWPFSCVAYRWFFTTWFLWACYRLARLYHGPAASLFVLSLVVGLYPLSVLYYWGQLTDPLSHALFVLSLIYLLEDRPGPLALSLALGVAAKETVVLLVPVYLACSWRRGVKALATTALLGVAAAAAFLAIRSTGWRPGYGAINGTSGLMLTTNLGIGPPLYVGAVPVWENYAHPLLFVGPFLLPLAWRWRRIDTRLRMACVTLTPLLLLSNLCFGWMYESRNYVPLVPLLATAALPARPGAAANARHEGQPR
jgi:hypothetical protein